MTRLSRFARFGLLIGMGSGLAACSAAENVFSFGQSSPDEFAVVSRAPLAVPPSYSLAPPRPGAPRPQEGTASDRARAAMSGSDAGAGAVASTSGSAAEDMLLSRTGAAGVDDSVRDTVDRAAGSVDADENFVQRLLFWQGGGSSERVVDPEEESARLDQARRAGRPLGDGDVPTIERREGGILSGFF
ncbi:DUF3035 domain-containing protein [Fodinicurvata sp. EGI_FJ10296]|uniref:DUF3035 domain-containing protein n=1 Tax=Fodinicurvata sp. EGI_FJ10296 TaxID=3231908 RepID=UPI0034538D0B